MNRVRDSRGLFIALAITLALVAIVVPTCRMVGCSMSGSGMSWGAAMPGLGFFGTCGGTYVMNSTPAATVPANADSIVLAIVAAVIVAMAFADIRPRAYMVRISDADPPPPPVDPLGTRLTI